MLLQIPLLNMNGASASRLMQAGKYTCVTFCMILMEPLIYQSNWMKLGLSTWMLW